MAINITDDGSTIKLEITTDYTQSGYPTIVAQTRSIEKGGLNIKAQGDQVVLFDGQTNFNFLYSDITTPSGGNAAAVAALIEAFLDTAPNLSYLQDSVDAHRANPTVTTYSAGVVALALEGTPTDVFTLYGSATKLIRVKRITISGVASTAIVTPVRINKRSTANTAGTSSSVTVVPLDSSDAAGTGTILAYTADPTVGTLVGIVKSAYLAFPLSTAANNNVLTWEFGTQGEKEIILRGTAEGCCISFGGATISSGLLNVSITWTEE